MDLLEIHKADISANLERFWLSLYLNNLPVSDEKLRVLQKAGYISSREEGEPGGTLSFKNNYREFSEINSSPLAAYFEDSLTQDQILTLEDNIKSEMRDFSFGGRRNITKADWTPDGLGYDYEYEFWNWINVINSGWQNYQHYHKFDLYRQQAYDWINEGMVYDPSAPLDAKIDFLQLERERMLTNSLYTLNKYAYLKNDDTDHEKGRKYVAWHAQEVMLYLFDLGLSFIMGKARQIGATSTLGAATAIRTGLKKNFFTKMVAEKGDKSKELFRDKVKYVIDKFPNYLTPTISNDDAEHIRFMKKVGKGKTEGSNSIFQVEPPTITCINGGSPSIVLLDEIGLYDIFGDIMAEGRPTLFGFDEATGRQIMKRQVIAWGTGGNMEKGGAAMEQEYREYKKAWLDRDFSQGIVPLFLNCFARKGITKEFYEAEKKVYYARAQKAGERDNRIVFHQSYPVTEDDMFLLSSETIIPTYTLDKMLDKCRAARKNKVKSYTRGHFVPIYDMSVKYGEDSDVPYKIIGARFQAASDHEIIVNSPTACACIIDYPQRGWQFRYYQGVDPIFTASGTSNMASVIKDRVTKGHAAYIDTRHEDYRYCYLQCLLMNLYYSRIESGVAVGIPQLVEANVGGEYINYICDKGYKRTLVRHDRIPNIFHSGGHEYGIRKTPKSTPFIINKIEQGLLTYIDTNYNDRYFEQLKTYVRKKTTKHTSYEPQNIKFHKDDVIDAAVYADICEEVFEKYEPKTFKSLRKPTKRLSGSMVTIRISILF